MANPSAVSPWDYILRIVKRDNSYYTGTAGTSYPMNMQTYDVTFEREAPVITMDHAGDW